MTEKKTHKNKLTPLTQHSKTKGLKIQSLLIKSYKAKCSLISLFDTRLGSLKLIEKWCIG